MYIGTTSRRHGIITTTYPVSCSYIIQLYINTLTHGVCVFCAFLSLQFFFFYIKLARCNVTASRTGLDRCRDRDGRRWGETWAAATTVWNYLPPPQAECTSIIRVVCVFQAQGLRDQAYRVEGARTSREPRRAHETAAVRTGVFHSLITFSDFRQIYE